jgi:hypothetical protein
MDATRSGTGPRAPPPFDLRSTALPLTRSHIVCDTRRWCGMRIAVIERWVLDGAHFCDDHNTPHPTVHEPTVSLFMAGMAGTALRMVLHRLGPLAPARRALHSSIGEWATGLSFVECN